MVYFAPMKSYLIKIYLGFTLLGLLPAYSFADDIPISECPTVPAIIAAGIKGAEQDPKYQTIWTAVNPEDHFGTQHNWSLEIEFISAKTADEAITKAKTALNSFIFSGVDMYFCIYKGEFEGEEITGRVMKLAD